MRKLLLSLVVIVSCNTDGSILMPWDDYSRQSSERANVKVEDEYYKSNYRYEETCEEKKKKWLQALVGKTPAQAIRVLGMPSEKRNFEGFTEYVYRIQLTDQVCNYIEGSFLFTLLIENGKIIKAYQISD